jgi:hypothetical protein
VRRIGSLGNIVGQIRVRIKAAVPRLFGGDDEVISVGITIGALQDDMKGATQHPIRGKLMYTYAPRLAVIASGVSLFLGQLL